MPTINDNYYENKISDIKEQVAYGVHEEPDNEYDEDEKYDKDTSEDDESGGHDDIDDKSYPEKLKGNPNHYWIFKT